MNDDPKDSCFIRITNKMIYEKLEVIEGKMGKHSGILRWHTWAIGVIVLFLVGIISALMK